jgi:hypothetical protein
MANTIYNVAYAQKQENADKPHWLNCGILVAKGDGKMSLKLNCLPVGDCTGWFGIFERDEVKPSAKPAAVINDDFEL